MAFGPAAGLELVDALAAEPSLAGYHLLPSVRGDLLAKLGRFDEARAEFERAASLTRNARERELLLERAAAAGDATSAAPRSSKASNQRLAGRGHPWRSSSASAHERHLRGHDRHEEHVRVEGQAGQRGDRTSDVIDVHQRLGARWSRRPGARPSPSAPPAPCARCRCRSGRRRCRTSRPSSAVDLREPGDRVLGRGVGRGIRARGVGGDRAVVDDAAAARVLALHHAGTPRWVQRNIAGQVDVHDLLPLLVREVFERHRRSAAAGVVEEHVEPAERGLRSAAKSAFTAAGSLTSAGTASAPVARARFRGRLCQPLARAARRAPRDSRPAAGRGPRPCRCRCPRPSPGPPARRIHRPFAATAVAGARLSQASIAGSTWLRTRIRSLMFAIAVSVSRRDVSSRCALA